jgi:hypothetical protein
LRQDFLDDLTALCCGFWGSRHESSQVAARLGEAPYQSHLNKIASARRDDWNHLRGVAGSLGTNCSTGQNDIDLLAHQAASQFKQPIDDTLSPPIFNDDILSLDVVQCSQAVAECGQ